MNFDDATATGMTSCFGFANPHFGQRGELWFKTLNPSHIPKETRVQQLDGKRSVDYDAVIKKEFQKWGPTVTCAFCAMLETFQESFNKRGRKRKFEFVFNDPNEEKSSQKFDEKESISGVQQLKSSVQKGIRSRLLELYPHLENYIDQVLPKKDTFRIVKCHDHIEIMVNSAGELLFFRHREGPWMPTLRLLHKYPFFLPMQQVDKGAIRFVLSGANIMCPGLTSPGARMSQVEKGHVVAVMAEGKEHALAIGITSLSTDDIAKVNKGVGIENCHYLNDGLWQMKPVK